MSIDHARRGVDWLLYTRTQAHNDPWTFVTPAHWTPTKKQTITTSDEPIGPAAYDTHFSPEDGNGIQHGWAGRSR